MADKISKRLVIDASVARSVGGEESTYPTSVHCREFLIAVLNICHKIVMTDDIKDEWNRHKSAFSRRWLIEMYSKKKVHYLNISIDTNLWKQIESIAASISNKRIEEMTKDLCLIEAANATDRIVVSLDDNTARKYFSEASAKIDELKNIVWVNPDKVEAEQPIAWLQNGAAADSDRLLVNYQNKRMG